MKTLETMVTQKAGWVRLRRVMVVFFAVVMLACWAPASAFADGEMTITVAADAGNDELSPGEEFSVAVNVSDNPGFAGLALSFEYDSNSLELVGFGKDGLIGRSYIPNVEGRACAFFSGNNINGDGLLFSVNFRVRPEAANGDYTISVSLKDGVSANLVSASAEPINAVFVADSVSVAGGSGNGGDNNGGTTDNTGTGDSDNNGGNNGDGNGTNNGESGNTDNQSGNSSAHGSNNAARNGMTVVAKAADGTTYSFMLRDTDSGREYSLDEGQSWQPVPDTKIITTDDGTTISVDKKIDADFVVEELPLALMGGDTTRQPYYLPVIAAICLVTCGIMVAVVYFQTKRRREEAAKERLAKKQGK